MLNNMAAPITISPMRTKRAINGIRNQYRTSVISSLLRHQGFPGLQADQWVNTAKTMPSPIEIGTSFIIVWPETWTTENSSLSISADLADAGMAHSGIGPLD